METHALLRGIRHVDAFFPSGGFAFSSGLETAVQEDRVRTSTDLLHYVADYLWWSAAPCDAVALARSHRASCNQDLQAILDADQAIEAMKLCRETRKASRQMGRNLLHNAIHPEPARGMLDAFREHIESGRSPGHLAVALGMTLQTVGWDRPHAIAGFLYQVGVGFVSASYKVLPIGQREGQRLLETWTPLIAELSQRIDADRPMQSWTPLQDIDAMRHSQLTVRLFRS